MAIRTLDVDTLTANNENIYEAVVVLSKRGRQIASKAKGELDEKLAYYEGFASDMENLRMQEEQTRTSLDYETRPKPPEIAIEELANNEIYFRNPNQEG
jgi:DNA-directed RNA polymerase subunit K/omega